jgi:sugar lactone lactonase YvrE
MGKILKITGVCLLGLLTYLVFAPVPIAPKAWDAPMDQGYIGKYAPNTELAGLTEVPLPDGLHGPEDVVQWNEDIYVSTQNGFILKFDAANNSFSKFTQTGGKPLGLEVWQDTLIVADAYKGLLQINADGTLTTLTNSVNGSPMVYIDDLDITDDGLVYASDASTKFGAEAAGSTLAASLLELMEHGRTGRLIAYDLNSGQTRQVAQDYAFSNGVAIAPDNQSVWMVETGRYRVLEIAPDGTERVIIDNLPGFPDNINRGPDGTYFVGLVSKRAPALDKLSGKPFWRKLIWRLPNFMKPQAQDYGFILQIDKDGGVVRTWQDPSGAYPATTGAIVVGDRIYVSSLTSKTLGYRPYP